MQNKELMMDSTLQASMDEKILLVSWCWLSSEEISRKKRISRKTRTRSTSNSGMVSFEISVIPILVTKKMEGTRGQHASYGWGAIPLVSSSETFRWFQSYPTCPIHHIPRSASTKCVNLMVVKMLFKIHVDTHHIFQLLFWWLRLRVAMISHCQGFGQPDRFRTSWREKVWRIGWPGFAFQNRSQASYVDSSSYFPLAPFHLDSVYTHEPQ